VGRARGTAGGEATPRTPSAKPSATRSSLTEGPPRALGKEDLALQGVDLSEDLLVLGETECDLVIEDTLPVDVHEEDSADTFLEVGGDTVLLLDGGLQTGGLGQVVSLAAVRDPDLHSLLLRRRVASGIGLPPAAADRRGARNRAMIRTVSERCQTRRER
jgi:hypothetical protein